MINLLELNHPFILEYQQQRDVLPEYQPRILIPQPYGVGHADLYAKPTISGIYALISCSLLTLKLYYFLLHFMFYLQLYLQVVKYQFVSYLNILTILGCGAFIINSYCNNIVISPITIQYTYIQGMVIRRIYGSDSDFCKIPF